MKVTLSSLKNILQTNACEIAFTKRRPKPGDRLVRNMLCTLDNSILNTRKMPKKSSSYYENLHFDVTLKHYCQIS